MIGRRNDNVVIAHDDPPRRKEKLRRETSSWRLAQQRRAGPRNRLTIGALGQMANQIRHADNANELAAIVDDVDSSRTPFSETVNYVVNGLVLANAFNDWAG